MKKPIRIIIAGGRDFGEFVGDFELMCKALDKILAATTRPIIIVSGGAKGADSLGEDYARLKGYAVERYPPRWEVFGEKAGFNRNIMMAGVAQVLVAFWDGKSTGTEHMIRIARKKGLIVRVIRY